MANKSTRFAGPLLASIASLALVAPTAAFAQSRDKPASKTTASAAKRDSALALSPKRYQEKQDRRNGRDGRPKDGPRDTGIKRGQDTPTSP